MTLESRNGYLKYYIMTLESRNGYLKYYIMTLESCQDFFNTSINFNYVGGDRI